MQAQNANMDGGMLELYPSPADLRKQQVADIQAKRQEKVGSQCTTPTQVLTQFTCMQGPPEIATLCLPISCKSLLKCCTADLHVCGVSQYAVPQR